MQIRVRAEGTSASQGDAIERRLRLVLGRYATEVRSLRLDLRARSGETSCTLHAKLRDGDSLEAQAADASVLGATAEATWRLQQRLRRRGLAQPTPAMRRSSP